MPLADTSITAGRLVIFSSAAKTVPPPHSDTSEGYEVPQAFSACRPGPPPRQPAQQGLPRRCSELLTDPVLGSLGMTARAPFPAKAAVPGSLDFYCLQGPEVVTVGACCPLEGLNGSDS